ncbi:hypothetical protein Caci_2870 [Catenulispora acidiphila DSM 44928]|uniref:Uncharacterized protein n=1 Tax=Catenulispora acidiphila (strain DSM 44928 / JCM 14897 / NBRC 102108 / NRRL B-24433 / ID139908) TaxID=479433 RepID=C7Q1A4_CATAD|nr:hypothetical protein [Catenulispora acidiphila]ACU71779.1 hypothetical protein Caci_2870 [Catenulispora acidiphila DSM 44928]
MTDWAAVLIVAGAGAAVVRRRMRAVQNAPAQVQDIAKAGELFGLAADWLRNSDVDSARNALDLIGTDGWTFAYNEVVVPSQSPRIAAMAGRMSTTALLTIPAGVAPSTDRLAQVETLVAIANEIKGRTWRY